MPKLARTLLSLRDTVLFYVACLLTLIHKKKKNTHVVGFVYDVFVGNVKCLYHEMENRKGITIYFVTANKKELERLRSSNVNAYYYMDIRRFPQFLGTDIWVSADTPDNIPFGRAYLVLSRFLKPDDRVRYRHKYHGKWVDLWHGGGGFKPTTREKLLAHYDLAFVTSQFMQQCFSQESDVARKISVTGNPRTDPLINKTMSKEEILKEIGIPFERKNIIYAPTWRTPYHVNFLWENGDILDDIEEFCKRNNCNFLIRMHRHWYRRHPKRRKILTEKIERNSHLFDSSPMKHPDPQPILYITDVLITDWSSIVSDFILLKRPIVFIDLDLESEDFFCLTPEDRVDYIVKNKQQFFQKLHEALHSPNLLEEKRKLVTRKMHKYLDGNSSKRCAQEIIKLLKVAQTPSR